MSSKTPENGNFHPKICVGDLRWSKTGHFCMSKLIFDFFQKSAILARFVCFFRLWGQFLGPKLRPIDPAMERAMVRHILRNISVTGKEEVGAGRPELQCKTSHFQDFELWAPFSPLYGDGHWPKPIKT